MTRDELLSHLRALVLDDVDHNAGLNHANADDLLLAYINDPEIERVYESLGRFF